MGSDGAMREGDGACGVGASGLHSREPGFRSGVSPVGCVLTPPSAVSTNRCPSFTNLVTTWDEWSRSRTNGHGQGRMVTIEDEWSRSRTNGHDQGRMVTDPIRSRTGDDASTVEITQLEKGDESPRRAGF